MRRAPTYLAVGALAFVALSLMSCAGHEASSESWGDCRFEHLTIESQFPGARANGCRREGPDSYAVRIEPEDLPINPSPWYAFQVHAPHTRSVTLTLRYAHSRHRYAPKLSYDGTNWFAIESERMRVSANGTEASFRVVIGPQPLWVAAQELLTNADYAVWMRDLVDGKPHLHRLTLGSSLEGRRIQMIESQSLETQHGTIVLVGRQHPPEVTGAIALRAFTEELFGYSSEATAFRKRYKVVVIPNLNPDGVEHGNWRHNQGGVDLNRDWGPFTQPETRLMRDLLAQLASDESKPLRLVLDFHSTWYDVMYTQRDDELTIPENFTAKWIAAIQRRLPDYALRRDARNSGVPSVRTYAYAQYGVPSITYEVGDRSNREATRAVARETSAALMEVLTDAFE